MPPAASIIVPTRARPAYLEVALVSVAPQARRAGAELIVVDDGALALNAQLAERFGARYVALGRPQGLNAARNAGADAAGAELLVFIDDDVEVREGWLDALIAAAAADPGAGVLTGPIVARFEGRHRRVCGREGPPITSMELGSADQDVTRAWGANLTIRRSALDAVGPFDVHRRVWSGDEEEWEQRHLAAGGRIRYVAAAALEHRRNRADSAPLALMRVASARGREARDYDVEQGRAPSLARELRVLQGCVWHTLRRRCANGPVMAAHSWGRISRARQARRDRVRGDGGADFLSGESGTVGGRRDALRSLGDRAMDLRSRRQLMRTARAAASLRRRVLVLSVVRERNREIYAAAVAELRRSGCEIVALERPPGELGKFENLNRLLAEVTLADFDWVLVLDDDIELPDGFLRPFLYLAECFGLRLAAPAHRLLSHAAWRLTRRQWGAVARETAFVEIGPLTALARETFAELLPFPAVGMGWGLDAHWSWLARERGWPIGVIDLLPLAHLAAPAASGYSREEAIAAARAFLAQHPYLSVRESQRTLAVHRRCA